MLFPLLAVTSSGAGAQQTREPWEGFDNLENGNAAVGAGFAINNDDLDFILAQLQLMDLHLANYTASEPCKGLVGPDPLQVPSGDLTVPNGVRVLDGSCNNLVSVANPAHPEDTSRWGAADEPFDDLFPNSYLPDYADTSPGMNPLIVDAQPREISSLVVSQDASNPAALAAGGVSAVGPAQDNTPTRDLLTIENVAPDFGLSAPFNDMLTFFGQFFDHGLDLTTKNGATVVMPLSPDDPLYVPGSPTNFMAISRSQDGTTPINKTTPYVDQNQTYTSHPSHQVFVRQYATGLGGTPVANGKLLEGAGGGMSTWDDVQSQALTLFGIVLRDEDITNVPLLITDPYGAFIPGPLRGLPVVMTAGGPVEGDPASPVDLDAVGFEALRTGHGFNIDLAHHAAPGAAPAPGMGEPLLTGCSGGDPKVPDSGAADAGDIYADDGDGCTYDDEMLGHHFIAGDGRANENIALTAVHHVFHSEHNRLADELALMIEDAGYANTADWEVAPGVINGEYLFQAAKLVTEMEYQHLAFEEFARTISPLTAVFDNYDVTLDAAITDVFAHSVYRFGHSMLNDDVVRFDDDGTDNTKSLAEVFLNPPEFLKDSTGAPVTSEQASGAVWRGGTAQVGQEIDEFVVDALQNQLLGIPLDLAAINLARGRDNGILTLNEIRAAIEGATNNSAFAPYESWTDFKFSGLKTPASAVNFVAAYGTHPTITAIDLQGAGTFAERRAAADCLVNGTANGCASPPADRVDFMNATGAYTDKGGLDDVDLWVGGLAESRSVDSGSMLGTTFDWLFRYQMEQLQEGDRFYYLHRLGGTNLLTSLEGNSLAEMVERNTTASNLPANVFSTPTFTFDMNAQNPTGPAVDDPNTGYDESKLLARAANGALRFFPGSIHPDYQALGVVGDEHTNWVGRENADRMWSGFGDDTLRGNDGNDWIQGGGGADNTIGGEGDDILLDSSGDDTIKGGPGNDVISGGPGVDLLMGNAGDDFILAGNDLSEILSGPGDDLISGGAQAIGAVLGSGDDWGEGGNGADGIDGDDANPLENSQVGGDDVLVGSAGDDRLHGEGGNDIFKAGTGLNLYEGLVGFDWIVDAVGEDLGNQIGNPPPIQENRFLQTEGLSGTNGDDQLYGTNVQPAALGLQTLDAAGIAKIDGLAGILPAGTTIFEDGNIILGGGGSDTVYGRGENDILNGDVRLDVFLRHTPTGDRYNSVLDVQSQLLNGTMNPGDFNIIRQIVNDAVPGDVDTARFQGPQADYDITVLPDGSVEVAHVRGAGGTGIVGNDGGDPNAVPPVLPIVGDDGIDILTGFELLEFNDGIVDITPEVALCNGLPVTIDLNLTPGVNGGPGDDVILGTPGPDVISGNGGNDTICGEGGDDTLAGNAGDDTILGGDGLDTIFGGTDNDTISGGAGNDSIQGNAGADTLDGDAGDDTISGNDGDDTINGGADNDTLYGVAGADTINGEDGDDTILGGGGADIINGGADNDLVSGNAGADTITGGDGDDTLYGSTEADTINGGNGLDTILGGTGNDIIDGGANRDLISGNENDDTINGGDGDDDLFGVDGNDTINGDAGADLILGGDGDDIINGGTGDDLLSGNAGADTIDGGDGDDTLYGVNGTDTLTGGAGQDTILGGPDDDTINSDGDGSIDQVSGNAGIDTCITDLTDNVFLCELP